MNDLIQRLVNAIIRQEGAHPDALNPGNLRGAPWIKNPIINFGFWCPGSREEGIAGLVHLASLHMAQGNSLTDFISGHPGVYAGFAPATDHNDPATYIAHVKEWAQIPDEHQTLWEYL